MIEVETLKRIYVEDGDGAFLELGECPDNPEFLEVRSLDEKSVAWWGEFRYSMSPEYAIALGKALVELGEKKLKDA